MPYTIHTVLTDNGIQFTDNRPADEEAEAKAAAYWATQNGPRHPWTNGQIERMNRTIKDATVKRYHYASHDELRQHLQLFVDAYSLARRHPDPQD